MPITIRRATKADLPAIAALSDAGFRDHAWSRAMYRVHDSEGNTARYLGRQTQAFETGKSIFWVAVDEDGEDKKGEHLPTASSSSGGSSPSGEVVGYARWEITLSQQARSEWDVPYEAYPVPEGASAAANDRMASRLHAVKLAHYRGAPMVLLSFLVVGPGHQRRGIGAGLLRWGLEQADGLGLPAWLEATDEGYALYERVGFRPVDQIREDFSDFGVSEPSVITIMRREPVKKDGSGSKSTSTSTST